MAQISTIPDAVTVTPLRWQTVRTFSTGATVVVAAFETEEDAHLFADEMFLRRGAEVAVRRDPVLEKSDANMRVLIRNLSAVHPADEDLEP